jgi:hypothetical protein
MKLTFGVFKQLYNGYGIYWDGSYNIDGDGEYRNIQEAKNRIDLDIAEREKRDAIVRQEKIASKKYLVARHGDNGTVTVETPQGILTFPDIRRYRQCIFGLEDTYDKDVIWE